MGAGNGGGGFALRGALKPCIPCAASEDARRNMKATFQYSGDFLEEILRRLFKDVLNSDIIERLLI